MDHFTGLLLVAISVLGLVYSIGNILTIRTPPILQTSLHNELAFYQGYFDSKRQNLREDAQ